MPVAVGVTCVLRSWIVSRRPASRDRIASFHAHSVALSSANSAKSST